MNKISIILTTYNVELYIEECIDSIINQTFKNFELIIIDDGSTDRTIEIIKNKYSNLRLIENIHLGVAKQRNLGIELASGEYICFLDSDDHFESNMLEKLYNSITENDSDLSICSAYKFDDVTKEEVKLKYMLNTEVTNKLSCMKKEDLYSTLFQLTVANAWGKLFKKSIIINNKIMFQDLKNSNDVLFVYSYMVNADKISFVYEHLVHYRANNNLSIQGTKRQFPFEFLKAYYELQKYLISINVYDLYKQSYIKMIIDIMLWNLKTLNNNQDVVNKIKDFYYKEFNIDSLEKKNERYNMLKKILGD